LFPPHAIEHESCPGYLMSSTTQPATHDLKRVLRLGDLVLFNVVAVLGLRWVATSAKAGPSSLVLWLLAALLFFIPQGIAVITLASRFPDEGGVYAWTRRTYGEWNGFLCGWCYWINNVLYYPNLLISTAVIATYAIGKGGTPLGTSWVYVLSVALTALWIAAALNIVGLGAGKWLHNIGGVATYLPGIVLIGLGIVAIFTRPSANPFTAAALVPNVKDLSTLNLWASIAFAFAGLELSSTMGEETANPRRDLPRAIVISAPLIAIAYILGTLSVLWLVPTSDLNIVSGFLQAISVGSAAASPALMWLAPAAAALYTLSNVAGVGAWLSGPARVAFVFGLDPRAGRAGDAVPPHLAAREGVDRRAGVSRAARHAAPRVLHPLHLSLSLSAAAGERSCAGGSAAWWPSWCDRGRGVRVGDHAVRDDRRVDSSRRRARPVRVRPQGDRWCGRVRRARRDHLLAGEIAARVTTGRAATRCRIATLVRQPARRPAPRFVTHITASVIRGAHLRPLVRSV
jgi:hypothetical protein